MIEKMDLIWVKCDERAVIPTKLDENAGADIYGIFEDDAIIMKAGDIVVFNTGLKFACSKYWHPQIAERGSTGIIGLSYRAGVFDSGFRNEWKIMLNNTSNKTIILYNPENFDIDEFVEACGEPRNTFSFYLMTKAIAQVKFNYVPEYKYLVMDEEDLKYFESERGEGMLGSSGK